MSQPPNVVPNSSTEALKRKKSRRNFFFEVFSKLSDLLRREYGDLKHADDYDVTLLVSHNMQKDTYQPSPGIPFGSF